MDEEIKKRFDTLEKKVDEIKKILASGLKVQLQIPRLQQGLQPKIISPTLTGVKSGSPGRVQKQIK